MTKAAVWIILVGLLGHGSSLFLEEDCGITYEVIAKINHGTAAGILQNPWMALIKTQEDFICGGTIITKRFVMTAAHCLCETQDCNTKRTGLIARLGEYNRSSEIDFAHTYEDFPVEQYYEHKGFRMKNHLNDIALLKLQGTIEYKRQIRPICILVDSRKKSDVDRIPIFTAVGWGYTEKGNLSDVLQTVNINRIPKTDCNNIFWGNMGDTQICGGTGTGKDTCKGDSGGPLYSNALYGDTWRRTQLGIISYGADKCGGIGVYTDVMSFVDFIVQTVMEHDITVLVPKIELLDAGCLDGESPSGGDTFPWLAEIYLDSFLINYGTLITDLFLLTTAQLVPSDGPLQVRLGGDKVAYKVKAVHKHPDFVSLSENDIAVIELEHKVNYTAKIKPICLPSLTNKVEQEKFQERANLAKNLRVVGWGRKTSTLVQRVDSNKCYKVDHQEIGSKQICVSHPNSNTLNVGSGSPLIMPLDHGKSKAFTLVGLASFGRREYVSQDVYTNVLSYLDWIGTLVKQ